ncbi:MAG: hypothetical protein EA381_18305 [Planctomycetaceae bacterium]|nr:MAG: hypothetical protein EA381_18305 [Planctomycetaceae bacterium]
MNSVRFVCPFCPLNCDDLERPAVDPGPDEPVDAACPRLGELWHQAVRHDREAESPKAAAWQQAREWVRSARSVVISGHVADLETGRGVVRFIRQTGAEWIAPSGSRCGYAEAFSRSGGFATTLGDAAAAHQTVILIGDPTGRWPRLDQRLSRAGIVFRWQDSESVAERLAALRCQLASSRSGLKRGTQAAQGAGGEDDPDLEESRRLIAASEAVVFVIDPAIADAAGQRTLWSAANGLIADLNRHIRVSLLRFDESQTLRNVMAWLQPAPGDGLPLTERVDVATTLASRGDVDLLIWLEPWRTAVASSRQPAAADAEGGFSQVGLNWKHRITIGRTSSVGAGVSRRGAGSGPAESLGLAARTPGISMTGMVIRGDGSVALPLFSSVSSPLPTVAESLRRLVEKKVGKRVS